MKIYKGIAVKGALLVAVIVLFAATALHARVFTDLCGGAYFAGDAGTLLGGELGFGMDISPEVSLLLRGGYFGTREDTGKITETAKAVSSITAGIQYLQQISTIPFFWTASAMLGGARYYEQGPKRYGPYTDPSENETRRDTGPSFLLRTGVLYLLDQRLGIFGEAGYQHSFFFGDFNDDRIGGFQVLAGLRFTFAGENKPIYEDL